MLKLYNLVTEGVGGRRGHSTEGHRLAADTQIRGV